MPMSRILLLLFLSVSLLAQSQQIEPESLFSQMIGKNIKKYTLESQKAYATNNFERAEFLFDSLINHVVNESFIDNFKFKKRSGRTVELYDYEKPIFLMTYASWCTPGVGEIPALNEIAEKYHKDIDFIVLFWDSRDKVKKVAHEYSRHIDVVYVDERDNKNNYVVQSMKHSLGFPTSFFIDAQKKIVDVRRGVLHPYEEAYEISFELNYNSFLNGISLLKHLPEASDGLVTKDKPLP